MKGLHLMDAGSSSACMMNGLHDDLSEWVSAWAYVSMVNGLHPPFDEATAVSYQAPKIEHRKSFVLLGPTAAPPGQVPAPPGLVRQSGPLGLVADLVLVLGP